MKEKIEVVVRSPATDNSPTVFELVPNNALPVPCGKKEVVVRDNPYGPKTAELIPQNS